MLIRLAEGTLEGAITLPRPEALRPEHPALRAMTDLRCGRPVTVPEDERLHPQSPPATP